jgi:DNA-binding transcriptional regulator YhcF (GntR family)
MDNCLEKIEDGLISSSDLSKQTRHPGEDIRPCISIMFQNAYSRGERPDRNTVALIIACELMRIDLHEAEIEYRIRKWNEGNKPPLRISEYRKAIRNAETGRYKYGCNNVHLELTCIGKDICPYYRGVKSNRKTYNNRAFVKYCWPQYISNVAKLIYYLVLIELERRRQVGPGGKIYASYREIAQIGGVSHHSIKKGLLELESVGLIRCKIGKSRVWERCATQIQRTIPIPKPSRQLTNKYMVKNVATKNNNISPHNSTIP